MTLVKNWFSTTRVAAAALIFLPFLTACETSSPESRLERALATGTGAADRGGDREGDIRRTAALYNPNRPETQPALAYARALRLGGRSDEAVRVLEGAMAALPNQPELLLEMGRARIADNRAETAIPPLERYIALRPADWQGPHVLAVALDLAGRPDEARTQYDAALKLSPGNPRILNNRALSSALAGNLDQAEGDLRKAAADRQAPDKVRGNLSLIEQLRSDSPNRLPRREGAAPVVTDYNNGSTPGVLMNSGK